MGFWYFGCNRENSTKIFKVHTEYEIEYSNFRGIWKDRLLSYKHRYPMSSNCILSDFVKLSGIMYKVIYSLYTYSNIRNARFCWIRNVKHILDSCCMSGIWQSHTFPNEKWLVCAVKQTLRDIFIANWHAQLDTSSSGITYRLIKTNFGMENYLVTLPLKLRKPLIQIRTRNHRLPIETGRWLHIPREERIYAMIELVTSFTLF